MGQAQRLAAAVGLLSIAVASKASGQVDGWAQIRARTELSGDVEISIRSGGIDEQVDLKDLARRWLGCDVVRDGGDTEPDTVTCRGMLARKNGLVDGQLWLSPLVLQLGKAGAGRVWLWVDVQVWPGQPSEAAEGAGKWHDLLGGERQYTYHWVPGAALPPPLHILLGDRTPPARPLVPLLILLSATGAIAFGLRLRARRTGAPAAVVWLAWVTFGAWLFWIVALPPSRIAALVAGLPRHDLGLQPLAGALVFMLPPMIAYAIALATLRAALGLKDVRNALKRTLAPGAALAFLFAFLLFGMLSEASWRGIVVAIVATIVGIRGVTWLMMRSRPGTVLFLEKGELRDRAVAMAAKAGVRLAFVTVLRGLGQGEANAFAGRRGRQVMISENLLVGLTKREVDAVIAHEIGHLRGRLAHVGPSFFLAYLVCYVSARLVQGNQAFYGLERYVPLLAVSLFFLMALISREREMTADRCSSEVTGDPEGMMAALARLAAIRPMPVAWGGVQGLIMSHPSMQSRVLMLANRSGIPKSRALAILDDPDLLDREAPSGHYALEAAPEFSQATIGIYLVKTAWTHQATVLFLAFGLCYSATGLLAGQSALVQGGAYYLLGLPLALWLSLRALRWRNERFLRAMMAAIEPRLPAGTRGEFAGLCPGERLYPAQGFFAWDLGKVFLAADGIAFAGERARFFVPRAAVRSIDTVSDGIGWGRRQGLLVHWQGGSFVVKYPLDVSSRRRAAVRERQWLDWWTGEPDMSQADPVSAGSPLPDLPAAPPDAKARAGSGRPFAAGFVLLLLAGFALSVLLPENPLKPLATVAAPLVWAAGIVLTAGWRKRR
ncbi:MAG TPA: M48 family metalloprotease [Bryobacteraceae bacterium]|nr:M48 family metalloprotease [Bryobacteraceae bacterium]